MPSLLEPPPNISGKRPRTITGWHHIPPNISAKRPRSRPGCSGKSPRLERSHPPDSDGEPRDSRIGSGGCCAITLANMHIFGDMTSEKISDMLDNYINESYMEMRRCFPLMRSVADIAGVKGEKWGMGVIRRAMLPTGFYLKKQMLVKGACEALLMGSGYFLVDGYLNGSYIDSKTGHRMYHDGYAAPGDFSGWRHSMAIRNGYIVCPGVGKCSIRNLWLDNTGLPDHTRGYFSSFVNVYRLMDKKAHTINHHCKLRNAPSMVIE